LHARAKKTRRLQRDAQVVDLEAGHYNEGAKNVQPMRSHLEPTRAFTVDEVYRMVDAGILAEKEHVELLDGELRPMTPQGPEHVRLTVALRDRLRQAFGPGFHVQDHSPVRLDDYNLPEPDIAVIRGEPDAFYSRLPCGKDIALVVEIAMTSQARDMEKAPLYAGAHVPIYWIVDIERRTLTIHEDPGTDGYRRVESLDDSQEAPAPVGTERWPVCELLPPRTR
jgi:Uma2 family endonuclease